MAHTAKLSQADVRDMRPGEYCRATKSVSYRCTGCLQSTELDPCDYGIATNGIVLPLFVCPVEECGTSVALVLADWTPFDLSERS